MRGRLGGLPLGAVLLPFVTPSHLLDMAVGWTFIRLVPATWMDVDEDCGEK